MTSSELVPIAEHPDGFVLCHRRVCREWLSLKLVSVTPRRKRNWWFGWNGERLSRSRDTGLLAEHHPQIYEWVVGVLTGEVSL